MPEHVQSSLQNVLYLSQPPRRPISALLSCVPNRTYSHHSSEHNNGYVIFADAIDGGWAPAAAPASETSPTMRCAAAVAERCAPCRARDQIGYRYRWWRLLRAQPPATVWAALWLAGGKEDL